MADSHRAACSLFQMAVGWHYNPLDCASDTGGGTGDAPLLPPFRIEVVGELENIDIDEVPIRGRYCQDEARIDDKAWPMPMNDPPAPLASISDSSLSCSPPSEDDKANDSSLSAFCDW